MDTENTTSTTNDKKVTISQLKKSLSRSKAESDKAIAAAALGVSETATDEEVDAMLDEVFGASTEPSGTEA